MIIYVSSPATKAQPSEAKLKNGCPGMLRYGVARSWWHGGPVDGGEGMMGHGFEGVCCLEPGARLVGCQVPQGSACPRAKA